MNNIDVIQFNQSTQDLHGITRDVLFWYQSSVFLVVFEDLQEISTLHELSDDPKLLLLYSDKALNVIENVFAFEGT